jgi:hypothetical protein
MKLSLFCVVIFKPEYLVARYSEYACMHSGMRVFK